MNYKPKANDKRKENNAIFFFETWLSLLLHDGENMSNSTASHSKFQSGNKKPPEISND